MNLGQDRETAVVLDEFPYQLAHSSDLESIIQRAFAPQKTLRTTSQTRLIRIGGCWSDDVGCRTRVVVPFSTAELRAVLVALAGELIKITARESVVLRDRALLHASNSQLDDGWTFQQFAQHLRDRVIFWPGGYGGSIAYGVLHFRRYTGKRR